MLAFGCADSRLLRFITLVCALFLTATVAPSLATAQVTELGNVLTKHRAQNLTDGGGANNDVINFSYNPGTGPDRAVVVIVYHEYFLNRPVALNDIRLNGQGGRVIGQATNSNTTLSKANRMAVAIFRESDLPTSGNVNIQLRYGSNGFSSSNANGMGAAVYFASFADVDQAGIPTTATFNSGCIGSGTPPGGTAGGTLQLPSVSAPPGSTVISGIGIGTNSATPISYPNNPLLVSTDDDTTTEPGFAFGRILYFNNTTASATIVDQVGINSGCNHRPITTEFVLLGLIKVDLNVAKSNGVNEVRSGTSTGYSLTVSNAGPGATTGAVVTDTPGAGLTCDPAGAVTITGDGVPAGSFTISDLTGAGIALGTLSSGQSATLSYTCQVN